MQKELEKRVLDEADYIVVYHTTIEKTAEHFGVSTATVHNDLTEKLPKISKQTYNKVRKVLDYNTSQRSTRGGRAASKKKKES